MKYAFSLVTMAGVLALSGCVAEKSFDVTGIVPPSELRAAATSRPRPAQSTKVQPVVLHKAPPATLSSTPSPKPQPAPKKAAAPKTVATFPDAGLAGSEPGKVTIVPDTGLMGKVASVNASLHFVVLNFPVGRMAAIEQSLAIYRQGQKIGEVKVTGPQQDDNIIADITSGEAETGDEVREK